MLASVGYHDANLELELLFLDVLESEKEARNFANQKHLWKVIVQPGYLQVEELIVLKEEVDRYQFRICWSKAPMVSSNDYESITWEQAMDFIQNEWKGQIPFVLESYYTGIYQNRESFKF